MEPTPDADVGSALPTGLHAGGPDGLTDGLTDGLPVGLPVSTVARRLGIAPATLRTWALRYGLGPSGHRHGAHRRYGPEDLARLAAMRRLTLDGVAPREAARLVQAAGGPLVPAGPARGGPGGRVLALPGADDVARGLGRAAMALDARVTTDLVRRELSRHGALATWEHVLVPVLVAAGERWAATGAGVEVEHLLAECVGAALREVAATAPENGPGRPVLLACAPAEQHDLPLHALAAALAERGVGVRILGAALPADALAAAVRRLGPAVIFVWSQLPATAEPGVLAGLPRLRPAAVMIAAGPGWAARTLPDGAVGAPGLSEAVERILQVVDG